MVTAVVPVASVRPEDETGRPDFVLQTATGVTAVDFVGSATS
jgi:hypothetical protein